MNKKNLVPFIGLLMLGLFAVPMAIPNTPASQCSFGFLWNNSGTTLAMNMPLRPDFAPVPEISQTPFNRPEFNPDTLANAPGNLGPFNIPDFGVPFNKPDMNLPDFNNIPPGSTLAAMPGMPNLDSIPGMRIWAKGKDFIPCVIPNLPGQSLDLISQAPDMARPT